MYVKVLFEKESLIFRPQHGGLIWSFAVAHFRTLYYNEIVYKKSTERGSDMQCWSLELETQASFCSSLLLAEGCPPRYPRILCNLCRNHFFPIQFIPECGCPHSFQKKKDRLGLYPPSIQCRILGILEKVGRQWNLTEESGTFRQPTPLNPGWV